MTHTLDPVDRVIQLYLERGHVAHAPYVSELQHALQCARFAERNGEPAHLVGATLMHDIGHLLHSTSQGLHLFDEETDARHELLGSRWLEAHFPPAVVEPIRLHVVAKRYLCTVDAAYAATLSDASLDRLRLQGGPLDADELAAFESEPRFEEAVRLRRYDDLGKVQQMPTPNLAYYRTALEAAAKA